MILRLRLVQDRRVDAHSGLDDYVKEPIADALLVVVRVELGQHDAVPGQLAPKLKKVCPNCRIGHGRRADDEVLAYSHATLEDEVTTLVSKDVHPCHA